MVSVNYEKLLLLNPDLVILRPDQAEIERRLKTLGVPSVRIAAESLDSVYSSISQLGELLGQGEKAEALNRDIRKDIASLRSNSSWDFGDKPPRVLLVVGRNPGTLQQIYAAGSGSFLAELMEIAGLENALVDTRIQWPVVSKESILKIDPDVILDGSMRRGEMADGPGPHMDAWNQLPMLRAVKNGRIIPFGDEHATIPGPSVARSARLIRSLVEGVFTAPPGNGAAPKATPNAAPMSL